MDKTLIVDVLKSISHSVDSADCLAIRTGGDELIERHSMIKPINQRKSRRSSIVKRILQLYKPDMRVLVGVKPL